MRTDSTIALNWIRAAVTEYRRGKIKGAVEMIIMQQVGILKELIAEFELSLSVIVVLSTKNILTRVWKRWKKMLDHPDWSIVTICCMMYDEVKDYHSRHLKGIDKTLYLVHKVDPNVSKIVQ